MTGVERSREWPGVWADDALCAQPDATQTAARETASRMSAVMKFRVVAQRPARPGWDTPSRRRTNKADNVARTLWDVLA